MSLKILYVIFPIFFLTSVLAINDDKVIYGEDNRLDLYEVTNPMYRALAKSTAALMSPRSIIDHGGKYEVIGATMEERGYCPVTGNGTYNYPKQITAAWCSGFLVGEDLLVTAGHCLPKEDDCFSTKFVFDYNISSVDQEKHFISKSSVYSCKKLEKRVLDSSTQNDYAIVRLDRKVMRKTPLKFRRTGRINDFASLVVIGHPTGLPSKIADGANVRSNRDPYYFVANLDTFGGNSGSAVFNARTGVVEGILVRGEKDYNIVNGCKIPNVCAMSGCRGEWVTRITNLSKMIEGALEFKSI